MKVKELIDFLKLHPEDHEVYICNSVSEWLANSVQWQPHQRKVFISDEIVE